MTVDFRGMLRDAAEPELAAFNSKLTPGKAGIIGVRVPVIRDIARKVVRDGWEQILDGEPESFEEEMLRGVVIATAPVTVAERISLTEDFLGYVDNWATCDIFCNSWKFGKGDSEAVWNYFSGLIDSGEEYRMRVSVIARMSHFDDGNTPACCSRTWQPTTIPGTTTAWGPHGRSPWCTCTIRTWWRSCSAPEGLRSGPTTSRFRRSASPDAYRKRTRRD